MTRRDVDLVIRAKDQAAKVVDGITKAIHDFIDSTDEIKTSASKTDGALSGLAQALNGLDKALRGATATDKLASELDRANAAFAKTQQQLVDTEAELAGYRAELEKTEAAVAAYTNKSAQLATQLEKEKVAAERTGNAHKKHAADLKDAEQARDRAASSIGKLNVEMLTQEQRVADAGARVARWAGEMAAAEAPTKRMQSSFEAATVALDKQTAKLAELRERIAQQKAVFDQAGAAADLYATRVKAAEYSLAGVNTAIDRTTTEVRNNTAALKEATKQQNSFQGAVDATGQALSSRRSDFERAEQGMEQLSKSAADTGVALEKLAAEARGPLTLAFRTQQSILGQMNNAYQNTRSELEQLSRAIGAAGVPTREMSEQQQRLIQTLAQIRNEHNQQKASWRSLGETIKGVEADEKSITAATAQAARTLQAGNQALQRSQQAANGAAQANQRLLASTREVANVQGQLARNIRDAGNAADQAARKNSSLADSYRKIYGESRQAMSWTQRLRGEVLALISAYGGIQGTISLLTNAVKATQTLEAAQSRLNVVFDGNQDATAQELDYIRRNADRLGVEFGQLAEEYTKFAAATKGTNLEGENTRKIFIRMAEAARVNKLSFDDLQGTFRALTQIASKGKVQLEELQGQLGDRLPGAIQIMADGLGITVAELQDLTKEGELTSDALISFAEEMNRRFGPQLGKALLTTTTAMGQLSNAVSQALIEFGKSGFIDGFNQLLRDLVDTLKSADFKAFSATASQAFGLLAKTLGVVAKNFQLVTAAAVAFAAVKLTPLVISAAQAFGTYAAGLGKAYTAQRQVNTLYAAAAGPITGTTRALVGLSAALRGVLASTGIGLAVTAIATGITYWATEADSATEALVRHRDIVDKVKNAYDAAGGSVETWRKEVSKIEVSTLRDEIAEADAIIKDSFLYDNNAFGVTRGMSAELAKSKVEFSLFAKEVHAGTKTMDEYQAALDKVAESSKDSSVVEWAKNRIRASEAVEEQLGLFQKLKATLDVLTGTEEEQAKAEETLNGKRKETTKTTDEATNSTKAFHDAMKEVTAILPGVGEELARQQKFAVDFYKVMYAISQLSFGNFSSLSEIGKTFGSFGTMFQALQTSYNSNRDYSGEIGRTVGTATGAELQEIVTASSQLAERLNVSVEEIISVLNYESGLNPRAVGGAGGNYQGLFQASPDVRARYGIDKNSSATAQIKALGDYLLDRGFKPGGSGLELYATINAGNPRAVNASDTANGGRPGDVTWKYQHDMEDDRAKAKAILETYSGAVTAGKELQKQDDKRVENQTKYQEGHQQLLADMQAETAGLGQNIIQREYLKTLAEREKAAKDAGLTVSQKEKEEIMAAVQARYGEQAALDKKNASLQAAQAAEQRVNDLISQRGDLMDRIEIMEQTGDTSGVQQAQAEVALLNQEIQKAAASAIQLWGNVGGSEAATAISSLKTATLEAQNFAKAGQQATFDWGKVRDMFVDGLVGAIDEFAQAVANGENAGEAAKRAFMKFAAQFLIDLGKMIVRQMLFNAVSGLMRGFGIGGLGAPTMSAGLFHSGGNVSSMRSRSRDVSPAVFANAPRFHEGTLPGLKPNEVPAILEKSERVQTAAQIKASEQQGVASTAPAPIVKIVNAIDSGQFVQEGLNTSAGEEAFMNRIQSNKQAIKEILQN